MFLTYHRLLRGCCRKNIATENQRVTKLIFIILEVLQHPRLKNIIDEYGDTIISSVLYKERRHQYRII